MDQPTGEPITCARCEIELGVGSGKCQRAKGTDICLECANGMYLPTEKELRGGSLEESPSYRNAMIDAGRSRLLP